MTRSARNYLHVHVYIFLCCMYIYTPKLLTKIQQLHAFRIIVSCITRVSLMICMQTSLTGFIHRLSKIHTTAVPQCEVVMGLKKVEDIDNFHIMRRQQPKICSIIVTLETPFSKFPCVLNLL